MRRLFDWLDLGHVFSGAAYAAFGVVALGAVSATVLGAMTAETPVVEARADTAPMMAFAPVHGRDLAGAFSNDTLFLDADLQPAAVILPAHGRPMDVASPLLQVKARVLEEERRCLAVGIYFEARGESARGQLAVARVILNRVGSENYPDTICGVVYQGSSRSTGCQFSFTCDAKLNKVPNERRAWAKAMRTAEFVTMGRLDDAEVGPAMFYHADYVQPYWAASMVEVAKIGRHIFYSKPRRENRS